MLLSSKRRWLTALCWLLPALAFAQKTTLSGYATDAANGEALVGATVAAPSLKAGTTTNAYGFFSLTLPTSTSVELLVSYVGYEPQRITVTPQSGQQLSIRLKSAGQELEEVQVVAPTSGDQAADVRAAAVSRLQLTPAQMRTLPVIGGERDVLKVAQLLPGIKRGGEGQTGIYVRGGGPDQNLILLDEAVVYNVSHLFGFLSVFNDDAIRDVTIHTGAFPAQYGGRISSVLDIRTREGDTRNYHVTGGVGLLSSRLTVDGPIVKDKAAFLVSGRRSYVDQILRLRDIRVPYHFYDFNAKLNWKLGTRDRLYYSLYYGNDILKDGSRTQEGEELLNFRFTLGNLTQTLRWNHLYSDRLFANYSLIYTRFRYEVQTELNANSLFTASRIGDYALKLDHDYYLSPSTQIRFGGDLTLHRFRPNAVITQAEDVNSVANRPKAPLLNPTEAGVYGAVEQHVGPRLNLSYGLRLSGLRTNTHRVYANAEPRLSASWALTENSAMKIGVARMAQYVHLVSSSSLALPTDLWYPVTDKVKPLRSMQYTTGYHQTVPAWKTTFSAEAYYKTMSNLIEYREGAVLLLNDAYEDELVNGKGRAYGLELLARRTAGRFTGWLGYTISRADRTFPDLNGGRTFAAKYDRRHDVSLVGAYELKKNLTLSGVWTYATGQRVTVPAAFFMMPNPSYTNVDALPVNSSKNAVRLPASHRLDLSLTWKPQPHTERRWHGEWQVGAYNVYNRTQPYRIRLARTSSGRTKVEAIGLFGFLPFISYNFSF